MPFSKTRALRATFLHTELTKVVRKDLFITKKIFVEKSGNRKKLYLTKPSQCKGCPIKAKCIGKSPEKRITITACKEE